MGRIILLDELTANKIAAGEVVERPASVVKELIENSIDAGSSRIEITITDGGLKEMLISDNGTGMDGNDAVMAFERHATSKIRSAEDLERIETLGFRGEALASIAAVSRLSLRTKTRDSIAGTEVLIDGGKLVHTGETGCPEGTLFKIQDLFYNTPARKKHMKSIPVEGGHISEIVNKIAMAHPNISFQLKSNNRLIFKTTGNGNLQECIAGIYGPELAREMLSVNTAQEEFRVAGYIGKPSVTRSSRSHQVIYVNGRFIKDRMISEAVEKAYHSLIMTGRYPVFVLHISISPEMVDVNVHPAKTVVRIDDSQRLTEFIFGTVKQNLLSHRLIPDMEERSTPAVMPPITEQPQEIIQEELNLPRRTYPVFVPENKYRQGDENYDLHKIDKSKHVEIERHLEIKEEHISESRANYSETHSESHGESQKPQNHSVHPSNNNNFPDIRPVAQIDSTYIIAQGIDGMYVIDQHAAHERIIYEKYMAKTDSYITTEQLLFPETVQLTYQEAQFLVEYVTEFTNLGFVIEHFGGNSFLLRGVPTAVSKENSKEIFLDLLDYFSRNRYTISGKVLEEKFLITMACKNAIKAGQKLGLPEMESLLEQLAEAEQPYTCPHGRPTIIHFSGYELEKKFKRVL